MNARSIAVVAVVIIVLIILGALLLMHKPTVKQAQELPTNMTALINLCRSSQFNITLISTSASQTYLSRDVTTLSGVRLSYRIENNLYNMGSFNGISYLAFNPLTGSVCYYGNFTNVQDKGVAQWAYPEIVVVGYKPWDGYPVYNLRNPNLTLPAKISDLLQPNGGGYDWIKLTYSVAYAPSTFPEDFAFDIWILYNPREVGAVTRPDLELMIWLFFNNTNITWAEVGTTKIPVIVNGVYRNVTWAVLVSCNFPWTYVAVIPQDTGNTTMAGGWRTATVEFQLAPFLNAILQFVPNKKCGTGLSNYPIKDKAYLENLTMVDIELGIEFGNEYIKGGEVGYYLKGISILKGK
ncbi:GH12 family glycosyl hydrolase domain-containing protein [Caldivirga sp. UBA161]|uniref:GH12 family glycosyl hydrolase domain-containing protein n=1 Tax=Caldivirga sp. UBA161 TaxID=1915569 RepID=UPI0025BD6185|nr:hypothetical protein [Caldivirga sp. UBA161]